MKFKRGRIIIIIGIIHSLLGISPFAFGKQFVAFPGDYFYKISEGLVEFPY